MEKSVPKIEFGVEFPPFEVVVEITGHQIGLIHMVHVETAVITLQDEIPFIVELEAGLQANDGGIAADRLVRYEAIANETGFNFERQIVMNEAEPGIGFQAY